MNQFDIKNMSLASHTGQALVFKHNNSEVRLDNPKNLIKSKSKRFLKDPIPLNWITAAAQLPGKSQQVGIALWPTFRTPN